MKKLLLFLAILLVLPIVSAASCPCTPLDYSFKITNTYPSPETFTFSSTVLNSVVDFSPENVTLASGKSKTIKATLVTPCSVYGNHTFNFKVRAENAAKTKLLPARAEIIPCYDYSVSAMQLNDVEEPQRTAYKTCVDSNYEIPLLISNNAHFTNEFDLMVKGKYAFLELDEARLDGDTAAIANISFKPKRVGNYSLFFDAFSELGGVEKRVRLPVMVEDCFSLKITAPAKLWVGVSEIPILLENLGTEEINAILSVDSEVVSLDVNALDVDDSGVVNLVVEDDNYVGVENVELRILLDDGQVITKEMKLIFGNPFFYRFFWYIVGAIIVVALIVLFLILSYFGRTKRLVESIKQKAGIKEKKETKKDVKTKAPKVPKPEGRSYKCLWSSVIILIILAIIFSLPIPTISQNLADESINFGSLPELKWNNNRLLRVDLSSLNASDVRLLTNDKVFVSALGKTAYLSANSNWTGSDFVELVLDEDTENVLFKIEAENLEGFFPHGVNVYKTLGIYIYDSFRTTLGISIIILIILLIVILLVIFLPGEGRNKIKKADHRLTRIVVK